MAFVWDEFKYAWYKAFRTVVPTMQDRIPVTASTAIYQLLCYAPFVFLAYLSRRPNTYPIRLLLLPSTITAILITTYRFTWTVPELNVYNWGQSLWAATAIAKALEFALRKEGMLKVGESQPGLKKGKDKGEMSNGSAHSAGHPYVATWLYDAVDIIHTMRGLRWKFGQGMHIPAQTRPLERPEFLAATFRSFVKNFLLLDFLESLIKLFPGVGTPVGGSIFYPNLGVPARYIVSTTIHVITGSAILAGFGMVYDLVTFVAVWLLDSSPLSWPPVMDKPWQSDSMHRFWAKDWHQLLRQTFLVLGGYPGKWFAGNIGMLLGVFIASGLFHECSMYAMGRGFDYSTPIFFAMQGPILLGERVWKKITGRMVGGIAGRIWVYFVMLVCGQPMINAWLRRGLGGGMVIPPYLSPTRWILLPLVKHLIELIRPSM